MDAEPIAVVSPLPMLALLSFSIICNPNLFAPVLSPRDFDYATITAADMGNVLANLEVIKCAHPSQSFLVWWRAVKRKPPPVSQRGQLSCCKLRGLAVDAFRAAPYRLLDLASYIALGSLR